MNLQFYVLKDDGDVKAKVMNCIAKGNFAIVTNVKSQFNECYILFTLSF